MNDIAVSLNGFSFAYQSTGPVNLTIDSLEMRTGEAVALVGRNGSGKSTLLLALAGLLTPQRGERRTQLAADKIALVFQTPCLDKKLTVEENLRLFGKVWGMNRSQIDAAIARLSPTLGLQELLKRNVQELSGGQQRRADLARALLSEPAVLFLDEPTVGLDIIAQREFWKVLSETKKAQTNLTLICASHHASELKLFDRILFLNAGRVALDVNQNALLDHLPGETLEINTLSAAEQIQEQILRKTGLNGIAVEHDKFLVHTDNATVALETIKSDSSIMSSVASVLVRRTQISDAVWQHLVRLSHQTPAENLK